MRDANVTACMCQFVCVRVCNWIFHQHEYECPLLIWSNFQGTVGDELTYILIVFLLKCMINKNELIIRFNNRDAMMYRYPTNHLPMCSCVHCKMKRFYVQKPSRVLFDIIRSVFYRIFYYAVFVRTSLSLSACRVSQYRWPGSKRELWLARSDPGSSLGEGEHCSVRRRPKQGHCVWIWSWSLLCQLAHLVSLLRG